MEHLSHDMLNLVSIQLELFHDTLGTQGCKRVPLFTSFLSPFEGYKTEIIISGHSSVKPSSQASQFSTIMSLPSGVYNILYNVVGKPNIAALGNEGVDLITSGSGSNQKVCSIHA